eukprot:254243-Chlamydomonas_euryale.AAC.2
MPLIKNIYSASKQVRRAEGRVLLVASHPNPPFPSPLKCFQKRLVGGDQFLAHSPLLTPTHTSHSRVSAVLNLPVLLSHLAFSGSRLSPQHLPPTHPTPWCSNTFTDPPTPHLYVPSPPTHPHHTFVLQHLFQPAHTTPSVRQVSAALNPENESARAFQECCLIRHPRHGEYAFAFVTGKTTLQVGSTDLHLLSVYVPTNHVYIGDIFMMEEKDVIHTQLSVREGLELVVSVGMGLPEALVAKKVSKHLEHAVTQRA